MLRIPPSKSRFFDRADLSCPISWAQLSKDFLGKQGGVKIALLSFGSTRE